MDIVVPLVITGIILVAGYLLYIIASFRAERSPGEVDSKGYHIDSRATIEDMQKIFRENDIKCTDGGKFMIAWYHTGDSIKSPMIECHIMYDDHFKCWTACAHVEEGIAGLFCYSRMSKAVNKLNRYVKNKSLSK